MNLCYVNATLSWINLASKKNCNDIYILCCYFVYNLYCNMHDKLIDRK